MSTCAETIREKIDVLIVEDDINIQNSLKLYFKHKGYSVKTADNGFQGIDQLMQYDVSTIILDIMMPQMNGITFLEKAKDIDPTIQFIIITGYADLKVAIEAMKKGASDFLTKPFRYDQLEKTVKDLVSKGHYPKDDEHTNFKALTEKLEKKLQELSALYSINEAVENPERPDELFDNLAEHAATITESEYSAFYLYEKESGNFYLKSCFGISSLDSLRMIQLPDHYNAYLQDEKQPINLFDPQGLLFLIASSDELIEPPKSAILAPLFVKNAYFGLLIVSNKKNGVTFGDKDDNLLKLLLKKISIAIENHALYETIYQTLISTLTSLVNTIEAKDQNTQRHSARVTQLATLIAKEMRCSEDELEIIKFAGILHDIGKIGISDAILQKVGSLTDAEFENIKQHPGIGARILEPLGMLPHEKAIILHHHERWDGRGYPKGLAGKEIPFLARIVSVADAWDAMTSNRVYRKALSLGMAIQEIDRNAWFQFDGNIILAFKSLFERVGDQSLQQMLAEA